MWYRRSYAGVAPSSAYEASSARRFVVVVARVLDFLFSALYLVLGVRLVLDFLQARRDSGFYELIAKASAPFYAPFKDIVHSNTLDATHPIVWSLVVAIVAYVLLHAVLRGLLRLVARNA
jgi:uncharacterized protein YggT (Ycf19 family)